MWNRGINGTDIFCNRSVLLISYLDWKMRLADDTIKLLISELTYFEMAKTADHFGDIFSCCISIPHWKLFVILWLPK